MSKIKKSYLSKVRRLNEVPGFAKKAVAVVQYQKRVMSLKKKGAIPFTETGFEKMSWDLYQKTEEPDFGSIWVVTTIKNANDEDEKWLVVNVDDNDKIIRSVKASITKTASRWTRLSSTDEQEEAISVIERALGKTEFKIVGGTTIGKAPQTVILDLTHQGGEIRVDADGPFTVFGQEVGEYDEESIAEVVEEGMRTKEASKKTSHTPGAIVQVVIPQGGINEKYNGKVGEVVAAVPDRSKISFKDMPSLWFEDNTIRVVASCNVCGSDISLQSLKKLGKVKCRCGAFYSWRQLERIAKTAAVNERAVKKTKKKFGTGVGDIILEEDLPNGWTIAIDSWYESTPNTYFYSVYAYPTEETERGEEDVKFLWDSKEVDADNEGAVNAVETQAKQKFEQYKKEVSKYETPPGFQYEMKVSKKAKIVEKGNEYCVIAESGRSMGCYATKPEAEERLKQVEMFKHMKGSKKAAEGLKWSELGIDWATIEEGYVVDSEGGEKIGDVVEVDSDSVLIETKTIEEFHRVEEFIFGEFPLHLHDRAGNYVPVKENYEEQQKIYGKQGAKKKAQNVIFWFDDPKALKNLRYLQGPPASPAEEEAPLEKPGLEGEEKPEIEAKEVEKEASKKKAITFEEQVVTSNNTWGVVQERNFPVIRIEIPQGTVGRLLRTNPTSSNVIFDATPILTANPDLGQKAKDKYIQNKKEFWGERFEEEYDKEEANEHFKWVDEGWTDLQAQSEIRVTSVPNKDLEVQKQASKKTLRVKKSIRNFEVGDTVQIMDKEGNTTVVPKATIAQVDEYLGTDGQMHETVEVTGSANEDEQMWYGEEDFQVILLSSIEASVKKKIKVSTKTKETAKEKIGGIVKEALEKKAQEEEEEEKSPDDADVSDYVRERVEDVDVVVLTAQQIAEILGLDVEAKKINRIEKTAQDDEERFLQESLENWPSFRDNWFAQHRSGAVITREEIGYTGSPTNPGVKKVYWENSEENIKGYEIFAASGGGSWSYRPDLTMGKHRFQKIKYESKVIKKAQGGSSFEALRGGGGGSQDQLIPMGWQVQESKTPQLPEGEAEAEGVEEVEEIVIRVSPEDKSVKIDFEGEKEEEVEKPVGAEAPPEKPIEKPGEGEEEEGLGEVPVNF